MLRALAGGGQETHEAAGTCAVSQKRNVTVILTQQNRCAGRSPSSFLRAATLPLAVTRHQIEVPQGDWHQRALPVVPPEGPSAGGGVRSTAVDPGVPLGPGLLATCPVFHGPDAIMTNTRTKAATIAASVMPLVGPSRWGSCIELLRVEWPSSILPPEATYGFEVGSMASPIIDCTGSGS
jgi:hypothetical protein